MPVELVCLRPHRCSFRRAGPSLLSTRLLQAVCLLRLVRARRCTAGEQPHRGRAASERGWETRRTRTPSAQSASYARHSLATQLQTAQALAVAAPRSIGSGSEQHSFGQQHAATHKGTMSAFGQKVAAPVRTYEEEMKFLSRNDATSWTIKPGFVPNMRVRRGVPSPSSCTSPGERVMGRFLTETRRAGRGPLTSNNALEDLVFDELKQQCAAAGHGGFLPAIKQIANVAALPGIVGCSMGMPDLHSGYGFTIGGVPRSTATIRRPSSVRAAWVLILTAACDY